MNRPCNFLKGKWREIHGQVQQLWGRLTSNDLTRLAGRIEELRGVLQQTCDFGKVKTNAQVSFLYLSPLSELGPLTLNWSPSAQTLGSGF